MCVVAQAVHCIVLLFTSHIRDFENLIWQFLQQMAIIYLILRYLFYVFIMYVCIMYVCIIMYVLCIYVLLS